MKITETKQCFSKFKSNYISDRTTNFFLQNGNKHPAKCARLYIIGRQPISRRTWWITCNRKPNRPLETVIQGGDYFALFWSSCWRYVDCCNRCSLPGSKLPRTQPREIINQLEGHNFTRAYTECIIIKQLIF